MAAATRLGKQSSDGSSSDGEVPFRLVMRIPFDEKNLTCWKFQMETQLFLIDALEIAIGNVLQYLFLATESRVMIKHGCSDPTKK
jgi:hypothetical protein